MNSIPCDIVLLPSDALAQKAISLSAELQKSGALFQLSPLGPFPHISLYMVQLKVDSMNEAEEFLANIAAAAPPLDLAAIRYNQTHGYIDAEYTRSASLAQLQMSVITAINPIRDGMREKDKARMVTATGQIRENLEQYGYQGVGELFRPHMTFTRFANVRTIDVRALPEPSECNGQFIKLGLFEMGDNGTCARQIATYKLGAPA